jgi:hypothetical protein
MPKQPRAQATERRAPDPVEASLGNGRIICDVCNCTLATFDEECRQILDVKCPGSLAIERARRGEPRAR